VGNWKNVAPEELNRFLEKWMAPEITLKISVQIAEGMLYILDGISRSQYAKTSDMPPSAQREALIQEATVWRALSVKLGHACADWHAKNQPKKADDASGQAAHGELKKS